MHWLHSIDQLIFHVGSTSHTTDEYYRVLNELLEDRQFAIVSAMAESKRCEGQNVLDTLILGDNKEKVNHKLKAEANLLQNKSRSIIATPALDAARLEIWAIQSLIKLVEPLRNFLDPLPLASQKIQHYENIFDLAWKAFVEFKSFGALSAESNAQLLARDLEFDFSQATSRKSLYLMVEAKLGWRSFATVDATLLGSFQKTVNSRLESSEEMQKCIATHQSDYMEAMQNGISNTGRSGTGNQIPHQRT